MATRKTYTRDFKVEAVKLVTEQGMSRSRLARDLGIDPGSLRSWIRQLTGAPVARFALIGRLASEYPVRLLCRVLGVSRSGY